ncbi:MAG: DUF4337 domain-containing protein [Xanthobacteraceae bacterium]
MEGAHEHVEHAEHTAHIGASNKQIALLISVVALFLAFAETLGKSAQTEALTHNVTSNDLWAFYQAKTIRMSTLETAAEAAQADLPLITNPDVRAAKEKQIATWKKTAERYDSDPEKKEGRKELMARAREAEHERDVELARYHNYEIASGAFQIAIVLASASVVTAMIVLAWISGGVAVLGLVFLGLGLFAVHFL